MLKKMKENSRLKGVCPEKITNDSTRRTVVKKLKSSGAPWSSEKLKNIDHGRGLDDYEITTGRRTRTTDDFKNNSEQLFTVFHIHQVF